ncbi:ribosome biogenesis/translation initiation ATPase RLI [Nitrososphaera sp. AFS]|uniref:ribosome biogenesis/translation initiation ATPase RLI n=1 Tax=Nitrososphaera sp. AFS TaxID=2301191 RepID=UPI0013922A19|nr:ribosome biogenesis/translation initiation ATPase RLI [Nitrososphaera sp. AFS]NAL77084.1 ribosome biogenesis/translation initiation ATPase RLI [Nitrososphaera sp. AFS]
MRDAAHPTHRVAVLDEELCQPKKCGLECIVYCPVNKTGGECIVLSDDRKKAVISEELCTGCGICIKKCPFDAIVIVNLAKELGSEKIHQYGINSFRLYKLPTLKRGHVVGLLGRNGMGKSTIVNILAGSIRPNLGNYESKIEWDQIIKTFQGTELQSHFEKIAAGQMRVSIKPQLVYLIQDAFKGTVKELIKKYDERNVADLLVNDLGLHGLLDRRVGELSGGELQRLAVAIASAKDSDYYFFDEPSSYNDVHQRLVVAKVIRGLAEMGKSVMVVEHDLTLLDYLSDFIHIVYGEPGAYGIVSGLQATKLGINNFLEGFIPSENTRFREKAFNFGTTSSTEDVIADASVANYTDLSKTFPSFRLKVSAGRIRQGEIVGVVGANSLGKTTFMRMLAGLIKRDSGKIELHARISFKPQYLSQDYDGTVYDLLCTACDGVADLSSKEEQILFPIGVKKLYEKNVKSLSGGELQKVAIAVTLARSANIYALDEPSAFLDVEDRIALAKFLQRFVRAYGKSAIVIDHDMQLIDLISDSLVIFDGRPGIESLASQPFQKEQGMNMFLRGLSITYRRDENTGRPRINKEGSRLDRSQKMSGNYYYTK